MNFLRLAATVKNERDAIKFFQREGVLLKQRRCTNGHKMRLKLTGGRQRWRCFHRTCRQEISVKAGTWFKDCHLPFRTILLFIYCWAFEMTSIKFCKRELGISKNTVVDFNNILREICAYNLLARPTVIGGPGLTVEIDESLFTKRKYNVGRVLREQWVFGGICRETKECFLYAVPDRRATTLLPIIAESIRPGSTIISDSWAAYGGIANLNQHFTHLTVNHTYNFVDPNTGAHTQTVERGWNGYKARNRARWGTHRTMLDSYLCEYMWRQRLRNADPFEPILFDMALGWPPEH